MRRWLIKQRTKPKHVRDNIAFGFASGVTALALVGWFVLLPANDIFNEDMSVDPTPEAFSTFVDQIGKQVAGVRDSFTSLSSTTPEGLGLGMGSSSKTHQATSSAVITSVKEAAIFVVPTASTTYSSSTPATEADVLY
jgi:hypothetical protein